jgi:hypothetical protein
MNRSRCNLLHSGNLKSVMRFCERKRLQSSTILLLPNEGTWWLSMCSLICVLMSHVPFQTSAAKPPARQRHPYLRPARPRPPLKILRRWEDCCRCNLSPSTYYCEGGAEYSILKSGHAGTEIPIRQTLSLFRHTPHPA